MLFCMHIFYTQKNDDSTRTRPRIYIAANLFTAKKNLHDDKIEPPRKKYASNTILTNPIKSNLILLQKKNIYCIALFNEPQGNRFLVHRN